MKNTKIINYIIIVIVLALACIFNYYLNKKNVENIIEYYHSQIGKNDTIHKNDTTIIINPTPTVIYRKKIIHDTLTNTQFITKDSIILKKIPVDIPISTKIYHNNKYYAKISGYKANLDTINIYNTNTIITKIKTEIKPKKGFFITPVAGFGYGIFNKKPDMYLGFGISYKF